MRHFLVDTYHGPLVFTQRSSDWIISSPYRPPEIFDGTVPADCLTHSREISTAEATRILGDALPRPWLGLGREETTAAVVAA